MLMPEDSRHRKEKPIIEGSFICFGQIRKAKPLIGSLKTLKVVGKGIKSFPGTHETPSYETCCLQYFSNPEGLLN